MKFYNDEDEDKKGAPVMPNVTSSFKKTSAFGKTPLFSRAAGNITGRLKNFSRKDLAFVAIGLGVLVTVPVAEYMLSQPAQDNLLKETFNPRGGLAGVMDMGINGLSSGSPDGSGEVITPLSARDPMSLILGSQPAVIPPSATPLANYRDAVKESGRAAFSEAAKSAGVPTPIPRLQTALRNLSFGGGEGTRTSGSLGGGKIIEDARSASSKAQKRSMVGPVAMPGYKGVASNTPRSASKDAFEKLRLQADKSAGNFSGGSAMTSLDKAAADAIDIGKGGGMGAGGDSEKTGKTSGSTLKYDHSRSGETLAEAAAKSRQQKALEWEFFKKYEIPKQIITAVVGAVSTTLGEFVSEKIKGITGMTGPAPKCWNPAECPDGNTCVAAAAAAFGANWAATHKLTELCARGGGPVVYGSKVGKESSVSMSEICVCGKGSAPTSGGAPAPLPGPADSTATSQSAAAAANLGDYDAILQDMVNKVVETEAKPAKAEENAKSVAGGFQNLSAKANGSVYNVLRNTRNGADQELNGYSAKIGSAQGKLNAGRAKYEPFVTQLAVLQKDIDNNAINVEISEGRERVIDEETETKIKDALAQWTNTGPLYFKSALENLEGQRKWYTEFSSQIRLVDRGIEDILAMQSAIDTAVSAINSGAGSGLDKLRKMSGRLQDVKPPAAVQKSQSASPAEEAPLKKTVSRQRALDWDTLWKPEHKFDVSRAVDAESSAWKAWQNAVSAGQPATALVPDSILSSQMRSSEITEGIKGMLPNFTQINSDLAKTENAISLVKQVVLGYGVSNSYFPVGGTGAASGEPPPPPALVSARKGALEAHKAASGSMERLKILAETDVNSLSAMKDSQRAQDAVSSYNKQMVSIDEEMDVLKVKIVRASSSAQIGKYVARLEVLKKEAASAVGALAKEYAKITGESSAGGKLNKHKSAAANSVPANAVINPKPDSKSRRKAATPEVIETIFLARQGEAYGLAYQSGVEQLVLKGEGKNSSGTNAYYSGKASRETHVFNVDVTCSYKAESNSWEIFSATLRVESGPATQTAGVSGGVSVFGFVDVGGNATRGALILQNGVPLSYPGFAGKPCK